MLLGHSYLSPCQCRILIELPFFFFFWSIWSKTSRPMKLPPVLFGSISQLEGSHMGPRITSYCRKIGKRWPWIKQTCTRFLSMRNLILWDEGIMDLPIVPMYSFTLCGSWQSTRIPSFSPQFSASRDSLVFPMHCWHLLSFSAWSCLTKVNAGPYVSGERAQ